MGNHAVCPARRIHVGAFGGPATTSRPPIPPPRTPALYHVRDVLGLCPDPQMAWVDAGRVVARVQDIAILRRGLACGQLDSETRGYDGSTISPDAPSAVNTHGGPRPEPAFVRAALDHIVPEPFGQGARATKRVAVGGPPVVVRPAPRPREYGIHAAVDGAHFNSAIGCPTSRGSMALETLVVAVAVAECEHAPGAVLDGTCHGVIVP